MAKDLTEKLKQVRKSTLFQGLKVKMHRSQKHFAEMRFKTVLPTYE